MSSTLEEKLAASAVLHGGHRLQPAHFEPERVPHEVARFGSEGGSLRVGSPGKVGVLELGFALRGPVGSERTELVQHYQKTPLQIMRPLYYDEARPDMPHTFLMTTGGGVLQGDRLRMDFTFGAGTSSHVTTQAHTKLYRMEDGYASAIVNMEVCDGAFVEFLPDPIIPFNDSRYYQQTTVTLHPGATLIYGETLYAGRLGRGERNQYDVFASDLEVRTPRGRPLAIDRVRLVPHDGQVGGPAVLDDRDIVSTLYVVSPLAPAPAIAECLHQRLRDCVVDDTRFGVSVLPGDVGAWVRMVGDDTVTMLEIFTAAWKAVHHQLTGKRAPHIRKC